MYKNKDIEYITVKYNLWSSVTLGSNENHFDKHTSFTNEVALKQVILYHRERIAKITLRSLTYLQLDGSMMHSFIGTKLPKTPVLLSHTDRFNLLCIQLDHLKPFVLQSFIIIFFFIHFLPFVCFSTFFQVLCIYYINNFVILKLQVIWVFLLLVWIRLSFFFKSFIHFCCSYSLILCVIVNQLNRIYNILCKEIYNLL